MNAIVLFPGIRYSCDTPLLYYAASVFRAHGYQVFEVSYGELLDGLPLLEAETAAQAQVWRQIESWNLSAFDDIIFVSKSIGTVYGGWAAEQLNNRPRQIFLTPLAETLPLIHPEKDIAVGAWDDPFLTGAILADHCAAHHIPLTMFAGVGHRLEDKGDISHTLDIMKEVAGLYEQFCMDAADAE